MKSFYYFFKFLFFSDPLYLSNSLKKANLSKINEKFTQRLILLHGRTVPQKPNALIKAGS